ncbi:hypothetical protein [Arcobacter cloacae]|uniref:Uncharacterized protein n=1 Tax=Arcobacter cloacae TaxID=1054034 RepID=A0A4Q0ZCN0_9BACT|nr:hypothetical protein [Arcobacter cloacae]RXJ84067.1 hypothetical protein CRU90_06605 [Arcobacter cloacae]
MIIKRVLIYIISTVFVCIIGLFFINITKTIEQDFKQNEEKLHNFLEPLKSHLDMGKDDFFRFMSLWNRNNTNPFFWSSFDISIPNSNLELHGKYKVFIEKKDNFYLIKLENKKLELQVPEQLWNSTLEESEIYISKIGQNRFSFRNVRPEIEEKAWIEFIRNNKDKMIALQNFILNNAQFYKNDIELKNEITLLNNHVNEYLRIISRWNEGDYSKMTSVNNFPKNLEIVVDNEIKQLMEHEQKLRENFFYKLIQ